MKNFVFKIGLAKIAKQSAIIFVVATLCVSVVGSVPQSASATEVTAPVCGTELVTNGSFEVPVLTNPQGWDVFASGTSGLSWQAEWLDATPAPGRPVIANIELQNGRPAQDGTQFTELDSDFDGIGNPAPADPASVRIYQDLITVPGKTYSVSFYTSPLPEKGLSDGVNIFKWNGVIVDTIIEDGTANSSTVWTQHNYTLIATASVTRISFEDGGIADSFGGLLDMVSVKQNCPTPGGSTCITGPTNLSSVVSSVQGTLNDNSPVTDATRTNPNNVTGIGDASFFSLGKNGTITSSFSNYVLNIPGNEITLHEVTNGRDVYPEEKVAVEVSQDGITWVGLGVASSKDALGLSSFDLSVTGFGWVKYIRVTDSTNFALHDMLADGYDLEAVDAVYGVCTVASLIKTSSYSTNTGMITYTLNWSVLGEGSLDLSLHDTIPVGTTYVAGSVSGVGAYNNATKELTWLLGSKTAGSNGVETFQVSLNLAMPQGQWASTVVSFNPGTQADLVTGVLAERSNPSKALGVAQTVGGLYDNPPATYAGEFTSLGFTQGLDGGNIVLAFNQPIYNGIGNDLKVFEVTSGDNYPDESAKVEVSTDNSTWTEVGVIVRDGELDLGVTPFANFVKIVGKSDKNIFESTADSFDVDAVKTLHTVPLVCNVQNTAVLTWITGPHTGSSSASVITSINSSACTETTGSIAGVVWNDADNDSTKDASELGSQNWTVYLDSNDNGLFDLGEASNTTSVIGGYSFLNLTPGMYIVREIVHNTWTQTFPTLPNQKKHVVFVTDSAVTDKNFGNFRAEGNGGGGGGGGGSTPTPTPIPTPTPTTNGGGNGGGGGASGGSGSSGGNSFPQGQILGDSIINSVPTTNSPAVLGGSTQLPRTGTGVLNLYVAVGLALVLFASIRRFKLQ